jgi:hypothetical protein
MIDVRQSCGVNHWQVSVELRRIIYDEAGHTAP